MLQRLTVVLLVLALGAGPSDALAQSQSRATAPSPFEPAPLATRVPDNAVAYLRLPTPLAYITAPKANLFAATQSDAAVVAAVEKINAGIEKTLADYPVIDLPWVRALLTTPRSPIEVLIAPAPGSEMPTPLAFLTMKTSYTRSADAGAFIEALVGELEIPASVEGNIATDGLAITGLPMPARALFDAPSQRLSLLIGPGATANRMGAFAELLAARAGQTPMAAMEARVDASRQELFLWLNVQQALAVGSAFIPPDQIAALNELGLANADALSLGLGSANGKSRLRLATSIPMDGGYRALIPVIDNDVAFRTTSMPNSVASIGLPTRKEVDAILAAVDEAATDEDIAGALADFEETLGFDVFSIFDALADVSVVVEDVGYYYVSRLRDRRAFERTMRAASKSFDAPIEKRRINGREYFGILFPQLPDLGDEDPTDDIEDPVAKAFLELFLRTRTPVFWTIDGDYVYSADMPQVLTDRYARGASFDVGGWLQDTQRHDVGEAMFSFSSDVELLPRMLHQLYLAGLLTLSDLAAADIDLWSLPSADDLGLPASGTFAGSISLGNPELSAELIFENTVLDSVISGGTMEFAFVAGILAAIAIPAYQDYTLRAEVAGGISIAAAAKSAIAEYYLVNGRYPPALEAREMSFEQPTDSVAYVFVQPDSGTIEIQYGGPGANEAIDGGTVWLTPEVLADGSIEWVCESSIANDYLPTSCRW